MLSVFAIVIVIFYLGLLGSFIIGFNKTPIFFYKDISAKNTFSVIIPFRNEDKDLPFLLESIKALKYSRLHFEILFVDDASEDNSVKLIQEHLKNTTINFTILNNKRTSNSPKKDAITTAIAVAKYSWIITTDADCVLPNSWLNCFNSFIAEKAPKVIVAPVTLHNTTTFFNYFQLLDVLSLQGATMGGFGIKQPFMANGANLAYQKTVFFKVNGFSSNNNIASGDDIFLLENALKQFPNGVFYLKSTKAIVSTKTESSFIAYFQQRLRWASKSTHYSNNFAKSTGIIVLLTNGILVGFSVMGLAGHFNFKLLLCFFLIKGLIDYLLIAKTARFFNQSFSFTTYIISVFLYPFTSVFVAISATLSSYKWKGRTFKK
ncbi:glycosyltransferase [Mangrovimonas spongiae]|uniref:Glycosyltransferase n=1 Tax=Mangrovimonas spongiae TaxID=2494697 RepID=A0A428K686_9FLAO|nr:glycosyltransferase [Mangrovimonas spongiae]RSK41872.1 glycosyltransferase [Mangrovimonas spongiae]